MARGGTEKAPRLLPDGESKSQSIGRSQGSGQPFQEAHTPTGLTQHKHRCFRKEASGSSGFSWDQPWPHKKPHTLTTEDLLGHTELLLGRLDLVAQVTHLQVGGCQLVLQSFNLWGLRLVRKERKRVVTRGLANDCQAPRVPMYAPGTGLGLQFLETPTTGDAQQRWVGSRGGRELSLQGPGLPGGHRIGSMG